MERTPFGRAGCDPESPARTLADFGGAGRGRIGQHSRRSDPIACQKDIGAFAASRLPAGLADRNSVATRQAMGDRHPGQESPCQDMLHSSRVEAGRGKLSSSCSIACDGSSCRFQGTSSRVRPPRLPGPEHSRRRNARKVIDGPSSPSANRWSRPRKSVQGKIQTGRSDGNAVSRPLRQVRSAGMSSRSRAFVGSTAKTAARLRTTLPTRQVHQDRRLFAAVHGSALPRRCGIQPRIWQPEAQAVDERLPAAIEIPDVAGESQLQLLDGRAG